jgi:hypothetical protein
MNARLEPRVVRWLVLGGLILVLARELRGGAISAASFQAGASGAQGAPATGGHRDTKQLQFKTVLTGEALDEDKVHLGITNFLASDGVALTLLHNTFPSALAAQEYFEKVLAKAMKVTERGEKKDTEGNVVGKRASAIVPAGKPYKQIPALLLTYGRDFYEIQSISLPDSRIMEMRLTSSN